MTYCLAIRRKEGLVFLADTRTNAGVDNIFSFRKQHLISPTADRTFVLESAGNLATTQEVLDRIHRDLEATDGRESLATVDHLFEAALYVGRISREVVAEHRDALGSADGTATFIFGGQIADTPADILMIYPEGNYIRASTELPFLQIGETKYGKFMLEIAVRQKVDLMTAVKFAVGSMMSTAAANLSVGPPYDLAIYRPEDHVLLTHRIEPGSPLLQALQGTWEQQIAASIRTLPQFELDDLDQLERWASDRLDKGTLIANTAD